jgi:DNA invertase Pin-like site-specific DNA recombinase
MGIVIGYARVSTRDQNLDAQIDQLTTAGCTKIYEEKESGAKSDRQQLAALLDFVREGDTVVAAKLDRIARSIRDLLSIVDQLKEKGATFKVLNASIDTGTPTGKLQLSILGAVGEFEREIMLERQAEGIAKAKEKGKYKGRRPTARAKAVEIKELVAQGMTKQATADQLGISVASVYRVLKVQ